MSYRHRGVKIPRPRRIKFEDPRQGYYHIVSRALQKEFRFKAEEKRHLLSLMKWLSQIYFVKIATFTILDNHFHMVLQMIREQDISLEEFRSRLEKYYEDGFKSLPPYIEQAFKEATLDDLYAHFSDISMFMWDLKLRFARWYNAKHQGYGHVWAERFTSVLLIGRYALRACMIYVELNSCRAGIVKQPETYAFTGLYHYLKGGRHASWLDIGLLGEAVHPTAVNESMEELPSDVISRYYKIIYHEGLKQRELMNAEAGDHTGRKSGTYPEVDVSSVYMHRIPAMTRGVFISDESICNAMYQYYHRYFRAQKRFRKSRPVTSLGEGLSSIWSPEYLQNLHSLPPRNNKASQKDEISQDKSE